MLVVASVQGWRRWRTGSDLGASCSHPLEVATMLQVGSKQTNAISGSVGDSSVERHEDCPDTVLDVEMPLRS